jgi:hypothetical protein
MSANDLAVLKHKNRNAMKKYFAVRSLSRMTFPRWAAV